MQIKRLAAAFGRLERDELDFGPGLNVIEAPDESAKSAWTAFLRVMLYGPDTAERGAGGDKRSGLPWSGSVTDGVLEAETDLGAVTLTRRTARPDAPLESFSAVYTGTRDRIAALTSSGCGETLLGVSRDVFERGAYIRQTGVTAEQSGALERHIVSLITTGEESAPFTAAAGRLVLQRNARQYNKTGLIPQTDEEIRTLRDTLRELDELSSAAARDRQALDAAQRRIRETEELLARHDAADQADALREVESARLDVASAHDRVKTLESTARALPSRPELESLQGRIEALASIDSAVADAKTRLDLANHNHRQAEKALKAHPFAGLTPAEAASAPLTTMPRPVKSRRVLLLTIVTGLVFGGVISIGLYPLFPDMFTMPWLLVLCSIIVLLDLVIAVIVNIFLRTRYQTELQKWESERGALQEQRAKAVGEYTPLYEAAAEARGKQQAAQAAWEAVTASARANLDAILSQLRSFRPLVRDLPEARQALDLAIEMRDELDNALRREEEARRRWEALRVNAPPIPSVPARRPDISRDDLRKRLAELREADGALRERLGAALGRIRALGDPEELRLRLREREERRTELRREYEAITLAMEVLALSGSNLQARFLPALKERAASIFTNLTGGRYNKELPELSTLPAHEAEQLYLAVRLAVCELALPADRPAPVILDDALVHFDDQRMAAALDYFLELSARRQILLFTCRRREGDYLNWAYPDRFHHIKLSR